MVSIVYVNIDSLELAIGWEGGGGYKIIVVVASRGKYILAMHSVMNIRICSN